MAERAPKPTYERCYSVTPYVELDVDWFHETGISPVSYWSGTFRNPRVGESCEFLGFATEAVSVIGVTDSSANRPPEHYPTA